VVSVSGGNAASGDGPEQLEAVARSIGLDD